MRLHNWTFGAGGAGAGATIAAAAALALLAPTAARADNEPPRVAHHPPSSAWLGEPINITCELKDDSSVFPPDIYWRKAGGGAYTKSKMHSVSETSFIYTFPAADGGYEYYIVGFDEYGNEGRAGDEGSPLRVEPQPKPEPKRVSRPKPRPPAEKKDVKPPTVEAVPVESAKRGESIRVEAAAEDESEVTARLWFRPSGARMSFRAIEMTCDSSGYCTAEIPDLYVSDDLEFYIEATDKAGNVGRDGSVEAPKRITLEKPAPATAVKPRPRGGPPPRMYLFMGRTWTWIAGAGAVVLLVGGVVLHATVGSGPFGNPAPAIVFYGLGAAAAGGAVALWFLEEPQVQLEPLALAPPLEPAPAWVLAPVPLQDGMALTVAVRF
jgi:hypothetical protein